VVSNAQGSWTLLPLGLDEGNRHSQASDAWNEGRRKDFRHPAAAPGNG
jgi:hypothetical protein